MTMHCRREGMRRPGVLPREGLEPGDRHRDTHAGVQASVQVRGAGVVSTESQL